MIENELFKSGVKSLRCSFLTILKHGRVNEKGILTVLGKDIAIVYFRTGYSDFQYHGADGNWCEKKW